jgi:hypothetical protein
MELARGVDFENARQPADQEDQRDLEQHAASRTAANFTLKPGRQLAVVAST